MNSELTNSIRELTHLYETPNWHKLHPLESSSIQLQSVLIELESSPIELESAIIELQSSPIQLESAIIELQSLQIQLESSLYVYNKRAH